MLVRSDERLSRRGVAPGRALAVVLVLLLLVLPGSTVLLAQSTRSVTGVVLDANDNILPKAVVYLKNAETHMVRSYIVGDDGKFEFHALASNTNYQLYAEYNGKKSSTREISAYDTRSDIVMNLKVPLAAH